MNFEPCVIEWFPYVQSSTFINNNAINRLKRECDATTVHILKRRFFTFLCVFYSSFTHKSLFWKRRKCSNAKTEKTRSCAENMKAFLWISQSITISDDKTQPGWSIEMRDKKNWPRERIFLLPNSEHVKNMSLRWRPKRAENDFIILIEISDKTTIRDNWLVTIDTWNRYEFVHARVYV